MQQLVLNATESANVPLLDPSVETVSTYVFEIVDEGSFAGTITVGARLIGRARLGEETFPHLLAITERATGQVIPGATGVTSPGIYSVDVSGVEAELQIDCDAGEYSAYGLPRIG